MSTLVTRSASASPSANLNLVVDSRLFPLRSVGDVLNFFKRSMEQYATHGIEPDLTLLSIIAGFVESSLTIGGAAISTTADVVVESIPFPTVTHELVAGLYKKFQSILSVVEKPKSSHRQATREIIKKVSDVIWNSLIRSTHKDRAHLQNLYSYLSGNKLDCFGVALAVVAGCQLLGFRDVHLAVSEDHAWVVFGNKRVETIEVTWHGKGCEDKRGQDITAGIESCSWLYLGGLAVVCDRAMEVAAIVSAINISLTANSDCVEVSDLQQKLLWNLYDMGHLKKYPMALGTLGELEEINPTHNDISCEHLYREAIQSARDHYKNHHVYPYTYQGNYYNRLLKYREAFAAWANAADVIRLYTYSCRDDEEIYKELLDIANEMIPFVMKTESSGHSARSILRDSEVFANLLRFYDGICQWEEDSLTPILHIGWAKPLVNNITKFDYEIRSQVFINLPEDEVKPKDKEMGNEAKIENFEGNNNFIKKDDKNPSDMKKPKEILTTLADLTAACGEKILNPEFLLQGGNKPFAEQKQQNQEKTETDNTFNTKKDEANGLNKKQDNAIKYDEIKIDKVVTSENALESKSQKIAIEEEPFEFVLKRPIITLYSQKMKGLKDLLLAEKLNTHAISLQVTAQSVASSKKVRGTDKMGNHTITSTYSTANIAAAASAAYNSSIGTSNTELNASVSDSVGAPRPKRTRRE